MKLLGAFLVTLFLLLSCKSDSPPGSTSAPPAATSTSVPAAATAVSEPSPTASVAPTATLEPARIEVIGDEEFKAWTQRAIELIAAKAPEAYQEVLASIEVIESVPAGSGMYVEEKRFAVGDETAHAPDYDEARQLIWFAGTIVHDAHHSALYIRGEPYTGKDAEVACLTVQKAALELLTDDPFFAGYVQGLIDGADDPTNQYWTQPNRHW